MGIIVPEATLVDGTVITNAYIELSSNVIYTTPLQNDEHMLFVWYDVYQITEQSNVYMNKVPFTFNTIIDRTIKELANNQLNIMFNTN